MRSKSSALRGYIYRRGVERVPRDRQFIRYIVSSNARLSGEFGYYRHADRHCASVQVAAHAKLRRRGTLVRVPYHASGADHLGQ